MKKRLLAIGLAVVLLGGAALSIPGDVSWGADDFYVIAASQFQRNGSNIFYTAGNVGIGTTSPGSPLSIQSNSNSAISASSSAVGATVISGTLAIPSGAGTAVSGYSASTDPSAVGVSGITYGGTAVYGFNNATTGSGAGVKGYIAADNGYGVSGENAAPNGIGVYGVNSSSSGVTGIGVYGLNNTTTGFGSGVKGVTTAYEGAGVLGVGAIGVEGDAGSTGAGSAGVKGFANGSAWGVWAYNTDASGFGLMCDGNSYVTGNSTIVGNSTVLIGTKSAVVPTSQGPRKLYSQESPEVWFEDTGEGRLAGGLAQIDLDPMFMETVTIDDNHPMRVFIQLNDDCNGVYVQRQAKGFRVKELRSGNSGAHFTYRVMAKRKGFENARLEAGGDSPMVAALKAPKQ